MTRRAKADLQAHSVKDTATASYLPQPQEVDSDEENILHAGPSTSGDYIEMQGECSTVTSERIQSL